MEQCQANRYSSSAAVPPSMSAITRKTGSVPDPRIQRKASGAPSESAKAIRRPPRPEAAKSAPMRVSAWPFGGEGLPGREPEAFRQFGPALLPFADEYPGIARLERGVVGASHEEGGPRLENAGRREGGQGCEDVADTEVRAERRRPVRVGRPRAPHPYLEETLAAVARALRRRRSLSTAPKVDKGSRTAEGWVMLPPLEPSPRMRTMYPFFLSEAASPTTFASPVSARKTSTPKARRYRVYPHARRVVDRYGDFLPRVARGLVRQAAVAYELGELRDAAEREDFLSLDRSRAPVAPEHHEVAAVAVAVRYVGRDEGRIRRRGGLELAPRFVQRLPFRDYAMREVARACR